MLESNLKSKIISEAKALICFIVSLYRQWKNWQKREIKAKPQPIPSSEEFRGKSLGRRLLKPDVLPGQAVVVPSHFIFPRGELQYLTSLYALGIGIRIKNTVLLNCLSVQHSWARFSHHYTSKI